MSIFATDDEVAQAMADTVADKGADYVYPEQEKNIMGMCQYLRYTPEGAAVGPSCLVGHVMVLLGVDINDLVFAEGSPAAEAASIANLWISEQAAHALKVAQEAQDREEPWGEAMEAFSHAMSVERR